MKRCEVCSTITEPTDPHCASCGEASFVAHGPAVASDPVAAPESEDTPGADDDAPATEGDPSAAGDGPKKRKGRRQ